MAAGIVWSREVAEHLQQASTGILCITADNLRAPWLNFEAGSLWKGLATGAHVCPVLLDVDTSELTGPLTLFQAKRFDQRGVRELCRTLAQLTGSEENRTELNFRGIWPHLAGDVASDLEGITASESAAEAQQYVFGGGRLVHGPAKDGEDEEKDSSAARLAYRVNAYLACFIIQQLVEQNPFSRLGLRNDWWVYTTTKTISLHAKDSRGHEHIAEVVPPKDWGKGETIHKARKLATELVSQLR
jgi:hypothetical protein